MKKAVLFSCLVITILLVGCKYNEEINNNDFSSNGNSEIAVQIQKLKNSGLLDEILISNSRSVDNVESYAIQDFIYNTDEVLEEIKNTDNGETKIAVINALFMGSDINDFSDCFSQINSEKAKEFEEYMNSKFTFENETASRCASPNDRIRLLYNTDLNNDNRGIYSSDLEWSTIAWYTGFCASTIAGFYLMSYGGFWLRIAGFVAATAGAASMVVQLIEWYDCSDLNTFISSLANKDSTTATKIANSETGKKLLTIVAETAATIIACYISPAGKLLAKTIVYYYNLIIDKILSILPPGINYVINGIPIKKI